MGQKGSKESSARGGARGDGTLVEALFIEQESLAGANDDNSDDNVDGAPPLPPQKDKKHKQNSASQNKNSLPPFKDENPTPQRNNLFQEELDVEDDQEKSSKKDKKRKSRKVSLKKKTPSRRRSARVAPTVLAAASAEAAATNQESDSENTDVTTTSSTRRPTSSKQRNHRNGVKRDVYVEIDDETAEPSMESETESLNTRQTTDDSEGDATSPVKHQASHRSSNTSPARGAAKVTIGAVLTPDKAARVGDPPEETLDDEYFTPMQLYNAMNDGQLSPYLFDPSYLLVVDTRDKAFYHNNHVVTAIHAEDMEQAGSNSYKLEEYTILLLYDATGVTYSLTDSPLSLLMDNLTSRKLEPVILRGGYDAFLRQYPFLCTDRPLQSAAQRQKLLLQYPSEILSGQLYLGKGEQATNSTIVTNLGLTHIVNITTEHPNAFPDTVEYLTVRREDEPSSDLHGVIQDIIQFTGDALLAGGKVLIHCNLGRSRSATAVIAYLMATRRWTLRDAYFYVKERRPIIDPNRGFLQQLSKFEKEIIGDSVSNPDELWMG